jgi:hypothetical protein
VGEFFDLNLMQKEAANLGLAQFLRGTHVESGELPTVKQIVASRARAQSPQTQIFGHSLV